MDTVGEIFATTDLNAVKAPHCALQRNRYTRRMTSLQRDVVGPGLVEQGSVVTIGAFDGVHRGHQALLAKVCERAWQLGLASAVISFEPLPREFFARHAAVPRLTSAREKFECLRACGVDQVLLLRFNAALAVMSAETFVAQVLLARLAMREIWVGQGFRFGQGRTGNAQLLQTLGKHAGFGVEEFDSLCYDGEPISSSRIRAALAQNDHATAEQLLGRPYSIAGRVVRGAQLGRKLGYPTANLRLHRHTAPVHGIFAVRVHGVYATAMPGVASLGVRPTINGTEPLLEAHLFDFDGDLYERRIEVEFVTKLRNEEKFANLELMVAQIDRDAAAARQVLGVAPVMKIGV